MPSIHSGNHALVTGASGSLGSVLLAYLHRQEPNLRFYLPIRARDDNHAYTRLRDLRSLSHFTPEDFKRCIPFAIHSHASNFGKDDAFISEMAGRITRIFNCAASIDLSGKYEDLYRDNVVSLLHVAEFAKKYESVHLHHVSTAYVSGQDGLPAYESDNSPAGDFYNSYERTKLEAEHLLSSYHRHFPYTIYRPSQISGDSDTGFIEREIGFYHLIKLALKNRLPIMPTENDAHADIIPIDFLVKGLYRLSQLSEAPGKTYYLVAGKKNNLTVAQVIDYFETCIESHGIKLLQRTRMVAPTDLKNILSPKAYAQYLTSSFALLLPSYEQYFNSKHDFQTEGTHQKLQEFGIELPDIRSTVAAATRYVISSRRGTLAYKDGQNGIDRLAPASPISQL
jgi:thioester reductase-like protein